MPTRAPFSLCGLSVQVLVPEVRHGENDTERSLFLTLQWQPGPNHLKKGYPKTMSSGSLGPLWGHSFSFLRKLSYTSVGFEPESRIKLARSRGNHSSPPTSP